MKDLLAVVVPVSGHNPGWSVDYGLALARSVGAHYTAMIAHIEASSCNLTHSSAGPAIPMPSTSNIPQIAAFIKSAAARIDVPCTILSNGDASHSFRQTLVENAQARDLIILDVLEPLRYPRRAIAEAVLFNTGRPIILVPVMIQHTGLRTVLIAWDESPSAVRALRDALPLLRQASDVVVTSVIDDKEVRTPRSAANLCQYLARWEIIARPEAIERGKQTVGRALLDHAGQIGADLLVMGGFGHAKEREFIFGSATQDIFESTLDIPVFLSH